MDPKRRKERTDKVEPNLLASNTEQELAMRAKERTDNAELNCENWNVLTADPSFANERTDTEDPTWAKLKILKAS